MDVVITYVNGLDPLWQQDYEKTVGKSIIAKRFRDWGTLPFVFRGIERNLPDVGKVHLVVARDSQVPEWIDRSQVNVVLHSDIFPPEKLPVFNSSSIEMFLHRIPGLSEEYVYLNDDFFAVLPVSREELFVDGRPVCHMSRHLCTFNHDFRILTKKGSDRARRAAGLGRSLFYVRPQHTIAPMLKSSSEELYSMMEDEILSSVTPVRETVNYNQYLYVDYMYCTGRTVDRKISNRHFSLAASTIRQVAAFLAAPTSSMVCINDVQMSEERYQSMRPRLLEAFGRLFPDKSRFEL